MSKQQTEHTEYVSVFSGEGKTSDSEVLYPETLGLSSNEDISILSGEGKTSDSGKTAPGALVLSTNEDNSFVSVGEISLIVTNAPVEQGTFKTSRTGLSI